MNGLDSLRFLGLSVLVHLIVVGGCVWFPFAKRMEPVEKPINQAAFSLCSIEPDVIPSPEPEFFEMVPVEIPEAPSGLTSEWIEQAVAAVSPVLSPFSSVANPAQGFPLRTAQTEPFPRKKPMEKTRRSKGSSIEKRQEKVASTRGSAVKEGTGSPFAGTSTVPLDTPPIPVKKPFPAYPRSEQTNGNEGKVLLLVQVDATGVPDAVTIASSSGYPGLDESARSTVRTRWRFKPAQKKGISCAGQLLLPIRFLKG